VWSVLGVGCGHGALWADSDGHCFENSRMGLFLGPFEHVDARGVEVEGRGRKREGTRCGRGRKREGVRYGGGGKREGARHGSGREWEGSRWEGVGGLAAWKWEEVKS
jgi:hypothetical protein